MKKNKAIDDGATFESHEAIAFAQSVLDLARDKTSCTAVAIVGMGEAIAELLVSVADDRQKLNQHKAQFFLLLEDLIRLRVRNMPAVACVRELQPCERG